MEPWNEGLKVLDLPYNMEKNVLIIIIIWECPNKKANDGTMMLLPIVSIL